MAKDKKTHPPKLFRVEVDYERYAHLFDDPALTEEQKREFAQTLWSIIVEFASLGFGIHPLQQAQTPCGKLREKLSKPPLKAPDALYLKHQFLTQHFRELEGIAAEPPPAGKGTDA